MTRQEILKRIFNFNLNSQQKEELANILVSTSNEDIEEKIKAIQDSVGTADGIASLNSDGKVPSEQVDSYTKSESDTLLKKKVDAVSGKGLSTCDFTVAYENKLNALQYYPDIDIRNSESSKKSIAYVKIATFKQDGWAWGGYYKATIIGVSSNSPAGQEDAKCMILANFDNEAINNPNVVVLYQKGSASSLPYSFGTVDNVLYMAVPYDEDATYKICGIESSSVNDIPSRITINDDIDSIWSKPSGYTKINPILVPEFSKIANSDTIAATYATITALNKKQDKLSNATSATDGTMSAADKAKLDGIDENANAVTVDSELSSDSENPVQNKVIKEALDGKQGTLKNGHWISIDGENIIDVVPDAATKNNVGVIQLGTGLAKDNDGCTYVNIGKGLYFDDDKISVEANALMDEDTFCSLYAYGIEWNDSTSSSPYCTRIGNLSLHKTLPIQSKIQGCVHKGSTIMYWLSKEDWNYKEDGTTPSVLDGTDGCLGNYVPGFYLKSFTLEDGTQRCYISEARYDDTWTYFSPCIISPTAVTVDTTDSTSLKACCVVNTETTHRGGANSSYYDQFLDKDVFRTGLGHPRCSTTRANMRKYARNNGLEILNYNHYKSIVWLQYIEYASFYSQDSYNEEVTADGYKQGFLGSGVTNIIYDYWNFYNSATSLVPIGYTLEFGNNSGTKEITIPEFTHQHNAPYLDRNVKKNNTGTYSFTEHTLNITNVATSGVLCYYTWYNMQGSQTYTISGIEDGQSISFTRGDTTILTVTADGEYTVDWGDHTSTANRNISCGFTGDCNISIDSSASVYFIGTIPAQTTNARVWRGFRLTMDSIWINLDGCIISTVLDEFGKNPVIYVYATDDPEHYSDSETGQMELVGEQYPENGYIKSFNLNSAGDIVPSYTHGNSSTYKTDCNYVNVSVSGLRALLVGGDAHNCAAAGLAYFDSYSGVAVADSHGGFHTIAVDPEIYKEPEIV